MSLFSFPIKWLVVGSGAAGTIGLGTYIWIKSENYSHKLSSEESEAFVATSTDHTKNSPDTPTLKPGSSRGFDTNDGVGSVLGSSRQELNRTQQDLQRNIREDQNKAS